MYVAANVEIECEHECFSFFLVFYDSIFLEPCRFILFDDEKKQNCPETRKIHFFNNFFSDGEQEKKRKLTRKEK